MSTRYLTNAAIALLGGFVVVASQAFSPAVIAWLGFAVAIAVLLIVAVAQFDSTRGAVSRALDGVLGALSIWTIVTTVPLPAAPGDLPSSGTSSQGSPNYR